MKTLTMAAIGTSVGLLDWVSTASSLSLAWVLISYFVFWMELHRELLMKHIADGGRYKIVMHMIVPRGSFPSHQRAGEKP